MHDTQRPYIAIALHYLLQDDACLFLAYAPTDLQQNTQIVPIAIVLHHVNVRTRLDRLVQPHRVRTPDHAMYTHLLMNTIQVVLAHITNLDNLARVDFLARIDSRSNCLPLSGAILRLCLSIHQQIRSKLRFAHLAVLAFTQDLIHIDNKVVHFSDLGWIPLACPSACTMVLSLAPCVRLFPCFDGGLRLTIGIR